MAGISTTHKVAGLGDYIKLLAAYGKQLPSTGGPGYKPQGAVLRSKLPNQASITNVRHPSGRPPAEHIVSMLATKMATANYKSKPAPMVHIHAPAIHPGKALILKSVKKVHLGTPSVKKVSV